jgi:hypothetical protein
MSPHLVYSPLAIGVRLCLCVMLPDLWPSPPCGLPNTPKRQRSTESTPFAGLTTKPPGARGEPAAASPQAPPPLPPAPLPPTNRRPRGIDTAMHFCPPAGGDDRGWPGFGNLRANGHPHGGPWRQVQGTACDGYFPEHHGPLLQGKRVPAERMVRGLAC